MATVKDIADAAGVSIGTVDRIIHNRGRFSEETAKVVRKAMKDLDYTPNIHARGLKKSKETKFGVVIPGEEQDGGYWKVVGEGVLSAAKELGSYGGVVEIFTFDHYSPESFVCALKKAVAGGVEGLVIAPSTPEDIREPIENTRVPYIFIDSDIPDLKGRTSYIGQDARQSGVLSGKLMSLLLMAKRSDRGEDVPSVLIVDPPGANNHIKRRIKGFKDSLSLFIPEVEFKTVKEKADDRAAVYETLEEFWSESAQLPSGIFVANSSVYYTASFLELKGPEAAAIPLIGYDLIPGKEAAIESGVIDFILTQHPEEQGYRGIMMLYDDIVLKKKIEKEVITPLNIITRENLHTFSRQI